MAKVCEKCGKSTASGNRIRHHHAIGWLYKAPNTKRSFKPNLRTAKVNVDGTTKRMSLCMKCYKTVTTKSM